MLLILSGGLVLFLSAFLFYETKPLKNIKALDWTLTLKRSSSQSDSYYILRCGSGYDYCSEKISVQNSRNFLDGLNNVFDIYSEDNDLVIVMRDGQDMLRQLLKQAGYTFDKAVLGDGGRREHYSKIYSLVGISGETAMRKRIIIQYVPDKD